MIFQEKPDNGNILTLSSVLDAAQATAWGTSAEVTVCGGDSGHCPRRQGAQARQGARERPEAWAPGQWGIFSINGVC